jgi:hypothetical protein
MRRLLLIAFVLLAPTFSYAQDTTVTLPTADASSSFVVQKNDSATVLNVRADGNVGIGIDNPSTALDVLGTVQATTVQATAFVGDGSAVTGVAHAVDADTLDGQPRYRIKPRATAIGGDQRAFLGTSTSVMRSVSVSVPAAGMIILNASGYFLFWSSGEDIGRAAIVPSGTTFQSWSGDAYNHMVLISDFGNSGTGTKYSGSDCDCGGNDICDSGGNCLKNYDYSFLPFATTRGVWASGSGTYTYNLIADSPTGDGVVIDDTQLNAIWIPQ